MQRPAIPKPPAIRIPTAILAALLVALTAFLAPDGLARLAPPARVAPPARPALPVRVAPPARLNPPPRAGEPVDWEMVSRIRHEGFHDSQVMDTLRKLTDDLGPRLTGSPRCKAANEWTRDQLSQWGLAKAHLESWGPFGRGWSYGRVAVQVLWPRRAPLAALPEAWSPGTGGPVAGLARRVTLKSEEDFEKLRGTLQGAILFLDDARSVKPPDGDVFRRYSGEELHDLVEFPIPAGGPHGESWKDRVRKRIEFGPKLREFLAAEGVVATVRISSRDDGVLRVGGTGAYHIGGDPGVPSIVMAAEPYDWVLRRLEAGDEIELEVDLETQFHDDDTLAYNTIAEIPGTDLADEIVMLGAHLDSWHAGTGATDNAAGCAAVMEAVRILEAIGAKPRRTIRVGLWTGEEQGLLGSHAYVSQHFAFRPPPEDPALAKLPSFLWPKTGPLQVLPEHAGLAAYFNLDNGSGKIRGIWCQENAAVRPIFEAWLEPFADLGADTVTLRNTSGTDHLSFDGVGLAGFQFIQDGLDYGTRTHHTNLDVSDHVQEKDLMQASVILASFAWHAATRDGMLPRKPMPEAQPAAQTAQGGERAAQAGEQAARGAPGAAKSRAAGAKRPRAGAARKILVKPER